MQEVLDKYRQFERDGFALLQAAVSPAQIEALRDAVETFRRENSVCGAANMRNLLSGCPYVKSFAVAGLAHKIASEILGVSALPVRAILFDKTPAANWYVTWHQDLSIPVKERLEIDGYGPWSTKEGVLHVQPPASVLEGMVALRIHLDPCPESNGAVKFVAGSHLGGVLAPETVSGLREGGRAVVCPAEVGDVIAMRPLVLHDSSVSQSPAHRRVLHIEYAGVQLPAGLAWAEA